MESQLDYCIRVIVNEDLDVLDFSTCISLSLVSRALSKSVKNVIELNFFFSLSTGRTLAYYHPKNIQNVIKIEQIHASIKMVKLSNFFNKCVDFTPFTNLTFLSFGAEYNQPIENLPPNITTLIFGFKFNQLVTTFNLPPKISTLTFGNQFDQIVDDLLPHSIINLNFGFCFNKPVNHLPPNLSTLLFGNQFNDYIDNLPPHLEKLKLGARFNRSISYLPPNLKFLSLGENYNLWRGIIHLPDTLTHLILSANFHHILDFLPPNLQYLSIGKSFNLPINTLPPKMKVVQFKGNPPFFNQCIDHLNPNITFQVATLDAFDPKTNKPIYKITPYQYKPSK